MSCFLVKISASGILGNILVVTINGFFWTLVCFSGSSWYNLLLCRPRFCRYENKLGMIAIILFSLVAIHLENASTAKPQFDRAPDCYRSATAVALWYHFILTAVHSGYIPEYFLKTNSNRNSSDRRIQSGVVPQGHLQRIRLPSRIRTQHVQFSCHSFPALDDRRKYEKIYCIGLLVYMNIN